VEAKINIRATHFDANATSTEKQKMIIKNSVYEAVLEIGGPTQASFLLHVNSQTIHAWCRKGYVPNFEKAKKLAKASGVKIENLRKQNPTGFLTLGRFS
jgi:hypothetical protein